jgi:hypothetical protein
VGGKGGRGGLFSAPQAGPRAAVANRPKVSGQRPLKAAEGTKLFILRHVATALLMTRVLRFVSAGATPSSDDSQSTTARRRALLQSATPA